eukprot:EC825171.1.p1 GENE.EC825171.1~~EC825171.1.p1  ORF type:complete len:171 (+),score=45.29 EC825171.1:53-565(+)
MKQTKNTEIISNDRNENNKRIEKHLRKINKEIKNNSKIVCLKYLIFTIFSTSCICVSLIVVLLLFMLPLIITIEIISNLYDMVIKESTYTQISPQTLLIETNFDDKINSGTNLHFSRWSNRKNTHPTTDVFFLNSKPILNSLSVYNSINNYKTINFANKYYLTSINLARK